MHLPENFQPGAPLITGPCDPACRAVVIIPARNEEDSLTATLDALRNQVGPDARPLDEDLYEVVLLLNNCTDASNKVAHRYQQDHPSFRLHVAQRILPPEEAHVGTARRLLMDTAFHRLQASAHPYTAILSTDADTIVARDWIHRNLQAIANGAEAVGGVIHLRQEDIGLLDPGTLRAYRNDRDYQRNVARLESLLDPDPFDPWPRHLEHFGASLACTPAAYARAGGLPPVKPLEDVAFIDALRRVDARLRHDPEVCIYTSARLEGRAEVGLSGQLRHWQCDAATNRPHLVQSAEFLAHRFSVLAVLRRLWAEEGFEAPHSLPEHWFEILRTAHTRCLGQAAFLAAIDCNRLIDETFHGTRESDIARVNEDLTRAIANLSRQPAQARPAETSAAAWSEPLAIPAG